MKDKRIKPIKVWAVIDDQGKIDWFSYRVPVFWMKHAATKACRKNTIQGRVVRVEIREIKP